MSMKRFSIFLAVVFVTAGFAVAQSPADRGDVRGDVRTDLKALSTELTATAMSLSPAPGGGDTDSFGRNVQFDGLVQSGYVYFQADCTPDPANPLGPNDRCVTLNPAPGTTTFDLPDIGQLTIPGKSVHSLMCHWLTPLASYSFANPTGVFQPNARFRLSPNVVVENPVLNDPSLIDPTTGLPFNGKLLTGFAATYQDAQSLDVNQSASRTFSETRVCIAGFISKQNLIQGYGLTDAQAKEFFKKDTTLHFGLRGNLALVDNGYVTYGLRVVGD